MKHLWQGLAALALAVMVAGCLSPHKRPDGRFDVAKHAEVRSLFGTNGGFDFLEVCDGPSRAVLFYMDADFTNCVPVPIHAEQVAHKYSQGQGGQIVNAATTLGGFGWLAQAQGGMSIANQAVAASSSTVLNIRGHYGR